mmetsp:Transcript_8296/g.20987  ORF Transcript_8296/g.20987 Transcript_8296/m.20987 type:complete len:235 (+) Transcript_8296:641-1345(+)
MAGEHHGASASYGAQGAWGPGSESFGRCPRALEATAVDVAHAESISIRAEVAFVSSVLSHRVLGEICALYRQPVADLRQASDLVALAEPGGSRSHASRDAESRYDATGALDNPRRRHGRGGPRPEKRRHGSRCELGGSEDCSSRKRGRWRVWRFRGPHSRFAGIRRCLRAGLRGLDHHLCRQQLVHDARVAASPECRPASASKETSGKVPGAGLRELRIWSRAPVAHIQGGRQN